jgi:hypothetical protein
LFTSQERYFVSCSGAIYLPSDNHFNVRHRYELIREAARQHQLTVYDSFALGGKRYPDNCAIFKVFDGILTTNNTIGTINLFAITVLDPMLITRHRNSFEKSIRRRFGNAELERLLVPDLKDGRRPKLAS